MIKVVDLYNQIIDYDTASNLVFASVASYRSQVLAVGAVAGTYSLAGLTFEFQAGTTFPLILTSTSVVEYSNLNAHGGLKNPAQVYINITSRNCGLGEIQTSSGACQACEAGTYLINYNQNNYQGACSICPSTACCFGKAKL